MWSSVKIFWNGPTSLSDPVRVQKTLQNSSIFASGAYNCCTTIQPVICQFRKNSHLVNPALSVIYKKVKIWHRFQCPILVPNIKRADSVSSCQPYWAKEIVCEYLADRRQLHKRILIYNDIKQLYSTAS